MGSTSPQPCLSTMVCLSALCTLLFTWFAEQPVMDRRRTMIALHCPCLDSLIAHQESHDCTTSTEQQHGRHRYTGRRHDGKLEEKINSWSRDCCSVLKRGKWRGMGCGGGVVSSAGLRLPTCVYFFCSSACDAFLNEGVLSFFQKTNDVGIFSGPLATK